MTYNPQDDDEGAEDRRDLSARALACETKDDRVNLIAGLMANGEWVTGVTFRELAKIWSLHPDTVKKDSAEASRRFQEAPEERALRKARWLAKIESAQANARRLNRCEAEAKFLELEGKAEGFFEPDKVELTGNLGDLLSLALQGDGEGASDGESGDGSSAGGGDGENSEN